MKVEIKKGKRDKKKEKRKNRTGKNVNATGTRNQNVREMNARFATQQKYAETTTEMDAKKENTVTTTTQGKNVPTG